MICNSCGWPATARSSHCRHACASSRIAGDEQGIEREGRVAQPAVAIIPVAHAADLLRQRGCQRGDDRASGSEGQRLERDERAHHGLAPGAADRASLRPSLPPGLGLAQHFSRVAAARLAQVRGIARHHEGDALSFGNLELADGAKILAAQLDRRAQLHCVGARDRAETIRTPPHPGDDSPVVETQDRFRNHRHSACAPLDHAHQVDFAHAFGDRHEIDHRGRSAGAAELGFEDQRVAAVAAAGLMGLGARSDQPAPVIGSAEQRREAGGRIEARHAEPVDRTVEPYQGGGMHVADDRVVLDSTCHRFVLDSNLHRPARARTAGHNFAIELERALCH